MSVLYAEKSDSVIMLAHIQEIRMIIYAGKTYSSHTNTLSLLSGLSLTYTHTHTIIFSSVLVYVDTECEESVIQGKQGSHTERVKQYD